MAPKQWKIGFKQSRNARDANAQVPSESINLAATLKRNLEESTEEPMSKPWTKRWKTDTVQPMTEQFDSIGSSTSSSSSSRPSLTRDFKTILSDFFLTNKLSALETHNIAFSAQHAGAQGVEDISKAGAHGQNPKNLSRDILRTLLKNASLPEIYWAEIPVLDPGSNTEQMTWFPFLLPHEVLNRLVNQNGLENMKSYLKADMVKEFCDTFKTNPDKTFPIGLHGDGAPFQAKMKDSLEQFSWNFPAEDKSSRMLFTAIPKKFVGPRTFDSLLDIFAWSLQVLQIGILPAVRHDGTPFDTNVQGADDSKWRVNNASKPLGFHGALIQVRGDWAFYNHCFSFPSWSSDSICWLCKATRARGSPLDFRRQHWKSNRYLPGEFEAILRLRGKISTLFKCPGLSLRHFMVDWLHAIDLGVGQSVIGNVMWEALNILWPNLNTKQQVHAMYLKLKDWYKEANPPSRLDALTIEMLKLPGKGPKLRSKAAECRYLLPFAAILARECDDGSPRRRTIKNMTERFLEMAIIVSTVPYDAAQAAACCKSVSSLLVALEDWSVSAGDSLSWRIKPKLHLMQELIEFIGIDYGSARTFWTYQDENWGGWLSKCAARRGGPKFAGTVALGLLQRYRAVVNDKL